MSLLKENVSSIEVGKRVFRVQLCGLLVVFHGTDDISHELMDDTTVCVELGSRAGLGGREQNSIDSMAKKVFK